MELFKEKKTLDLEDVLDSRTTRGGRKGRRSPAWTSPPSDCCAHPPIILQEDIPLEELFDNEDIPQEEVFDNLRCSRGASKSCSFSVLGTLIWIKFSTDGVATNSRSYAICVFVSAFAWSWGPLGWLVPSEIFPLEIRSAAQSMVVVCNMAFTFVIAQIFLMMLCRLKFGLFYFFGACELLMTAFVYFFLPETKGIPIEEMDRIWATHWYWKRFVEGNGGRKVQLTSANAV